MADLIPPHGGLTEPISRTVPANEIEASKAEAAKLPKVPVSQADLSTVLASRTVRSACSTGPMSRKVYDRVLDESVIEHGGNLRCSWTIPLSFPVTKEVAATLAPGKKVALTAPDGEVVATLDVTDVFEWDKPRYLKSVYGTERTDHPDADMVLNRRRRQNPFDRRRAEGLAAGEEPELWRRCAVAARSAGPLGQERLDGCGRLPDA